MSANAECPRASIVVVTRNRAGVLSSCLRSALAQEPRVPVILIDDASDDDTEQTVRGAFPEVLYQRLEQQTGCPGARNAGLALVSTEFVVFLDDDATFQDTRTVAETVASFSDPRIAAIAIPYIENGKLLQSAPDRTRVWLTNTYYGAAHALRSEVVRSLGGYRSALRFYVEEHDLCIRLLRQGYLVRLGHTTPAIHSPHQDRSAADADLSRARRFKQLMRNEALFKWWHTPLPYLPAVMLHHVYQACFQRGGKPVDGLRAVSSAIGFLREHHIPRAPVPLHTYRQWRWLSRESGRRSLEDLESQTA